MDITNKPMKMGHMNERHTAGKVVISYTDSIKQHQTFPVKHKSYKEIRPRPCRPDTPPLKSLTYWIYFCYLLLDKMLGLHLKTSYF